MQLTLIISTEEIGETVGSMTDKILDEIVEIGRKANVSDRDSVHRTGVHNLAKFVVLLGHNEPSCRVRGEARLKITSSYLSIEKLDHAGKKSLRNGNRLVNPRLVFYNRNLII
jgi:hypothetical protein